MKKLLPMTVALVLALGAALPVGAVTVIISEYVEGSSNNKAIELFNRTATAINLSTGTYSLEIYFNGSATPGSPIPLTGTIPANGTYVITHTSATAALLALANQSTGSLQFNGDDAVALKQGTNFLDVIGQIGFDPGTEWGTGVQSTADNTIRRKADVCGGDVDGSNAFVPSLEWDGFAVDTFSGLGAHAANCIPVAVEQQTWGTVKVLFR